MRVRTAFLGGGFGAKLYIKLEALVAVCALLVRKPVRIALTMDEQFYTITKHGATVRIKTGVKNDGRMIARQVETFWNGGAYADIGPRVTQKSGFTAAGPYDIEHVALDNYAVYTNEPPAGALRGFGISQVSWAYERQADIIARTLGIDPLEFRRRNVLREGRPHATGTRDVQPGNPGRAGPACRAHGVGPPLRPRAPEPSAADAGSRIGLKACISPTTSVAIVQVYGDGSCAVHCGTVDMGQGSDTAMAQMAARGAGDSRPNPSGSCTPIPSSTPYDMGTLGSRSTFHMGNAVRMAALRTSARSCWESPAARSASIRPISNVVMRRLCRGDGRRLTLREIMLARFAMQAGNLVGVGSYAPSYEKADPETGQSPDITPFWMLGGAGAEIAVDMETGRITVTKLVNVADVGRAINPSIVERQLIGAAIMQVGVHALRGNDLQRRAGAERQPRRLQDPGIPRSARGSVGRLR